jgi:hypothetical protein
MRTNALARVRLAALGMALLAEVVDDQRSDPRPAGSPGLRGRMAPGLRRRLAAGLRRRAEVAPRQKALERERPLAMMRTVRLLGLVTFLWATLGLPALHALEHAREVDEPAHTDDIHQLLREVLARGKSGGHHHHHHGDQPVAPGAPDPSHGHGSAQHFSLAVVVAPPPLLPPRAADFETLTDLAPAGMPAARDLRSPRTSRGPPPARWA